MLLDRKAKVNQRNAVSEDAMMLAAFKGQLETVRLLRSKGGDINKAAGLRFITPRSRARPRSAKYLIDNKAEIDAEAPNGVTPLMAAVRNGHWRS